MAVPTAYTVSPEAPLLGELSSDSETERLDTQPCIQSAGHYCFRYAELYSVSTNCIYLPRALPLGELSPQATERASPAEAKIEAQRYDGSWGAAPYRCACVLFCQRPEGVALPQEADDQICRTAAEHSQNGVRLELAQGNESGGEDQNTDPVDRRQCERTIREADQFQDG